MARIPPIPVAESAADARDILEHHQREYGRVTNMKRTLARSPVALRAMMQWYPLHREVVAFLGLLATMIFTHAISSQTDCLICSTFFRRWLVEAGEDPDTLPLQERERVVADFGRQLARDANGVSDELFAALRAFLEPDQIVTLTTFGGLMIATNIFNNALRVDLDEYLYPYRKGGVSGQPAKRADA
jgi:alkylhydroperoxidase family enzyme